MLTEPLCSSHSFCHKKYSTSKIRYSLRSPQNEGTKGEQLHLFLFSSLDGGEGSTLSTDGFTPQSHTEQEAEWALEAYWILL
jgi:hypothetical protein